MNTTIEIHQSRPILVCLHGSASNGNMWRDFRTLVRDRALVIAPDLPGLGEKALDDDVEAVMRHVGETGQPFHVIAHGRGAAVAACIANRYPDRVASMVCYEPAGISRGLARGISTPVQMLCGTRSWKAARQAAERTTERVSQARLLKLVGLRHMAPLTHPHILNPVILDYVLPVVMPDQFKAA